MYCAQSYLTPEPSAIAQQLHTWQQSWPQMGVLALLPEQEAAHLPTLQAACNAYGIPLRGGIFPALVTDNGFATQGMWLVAFAHMPPSFLVSGLEQFGTQKVVSATRQALAACEAGTPPHLFMVFDGMYPNIGSLLDEVHAELDASVVYSGVNAGSETFQPMPCLFDNNQIIGMGVLGLMLPAGSEPVLKHGYPVSKRLMSATSSVGNCIERIDDRPAFEVYQAVVEAEYGVKLTHDNFYDLAVHFPFGLITAIDVLVRIPVALTTEGSLFCVGEVPPNTMLRLLHAPALEDSQCVEDIATELAKKRTADQTAPPLLTFYCAGRRMHFGPQATLEVTHLKTATGSPCIFGALSLGEIDSMEDLDIPRFHNAAIVCQTLRPR